MPAQTTKTDKDDMVLAIPLRLHAPRHPLLTTALMLREKVRAETAQQSFAPGRRFPEEWATVVVRQNRDGTSRGNNIVNLKLPKHSQLVTTT